ncbi:MAG: hypothetical protein ABH827_03275 [bacterium]
MKFIKLSSINIKIYILCLLTSIITQDIYARLRFVDQSASIGIQPGYSRVRISHNDNAQGWFQQSIIPATGMDNSWLTDNTIIGYGSGITQKAPTSFTYNNSNAIAKQALTTDIALNYNTPTTFDNRMRHNSNAINYLAPIIRNSSYLIRQTSTALIYGIHNNSTALVSITEQVNIGGEIITQPTYPFSHNFFLSTKKYLNFTQNCIINGNGHFILFAQNNPGCIEVAADKTLTFSNVALKDFSDDAITLAAGAKIIFGHGTTIALSHFKPSNKLSRNWIFNGRNMTIYGFNNSLDMNSLSIQVTGTLALQNIILNNLKHSLLNATNTQSNIILRDATLNLSDSYSYTTGALEIQRDALISGTKVFNYKSNQQLAIDSNSTLIIDAGSSFKYDPTSTNRDLIFMKDGTSRLYLNGCELSSSPTGLRLTKGTLLLDGSNDVTTPDSRETAKSEWISLGNGKKADNLNIVQFPGTVIKKADGIPGYLIINNV